MKNILFLLLCSFVFLSCTSAPDSGSNTSSDSTTKTKREIPVVPVFDRPHAIVLDMWIYGKREYEDYVKVYNATLHENITFNVFAYDSKNERWVLIGPARLKKVTDRDTIDSALNRELDRFRWFAIHSLDNLEFSAQVVIKNNDILITVFEE